MHKYNVIFFIIICFLNGTDTILADEDVCLGKRPDTTISEIKKWYEKYKSNEKLADEYFKGVSKGFELGVQGRPAHLPLINKHMTIENAALDGLNVGYHHGRAVYCTMAGENAKYRMP